MAFKLETTYRWESAGGSFKTLPVQIARMTKARPCDLAGEVIDWPSG